MTTKEFMLEQTQCTQHRSDLGTEFCTQVPRMMGTGSGASQASAPSPDFQKLKLKKIVNLANINSKN